MSGIKENQEITSVKQVRLTPLRSISIIQAKGLLLPKVHETTLEPSVVLMAPHLINLAFSSIAKLPKSQTLNDVRNKATETTYRALKQVSISNFEAANRIVTQISQIQVAGSIAEIKNACIQINEICLKEQAPAYKEAISQTVKQVMSEVGFPLITVKAIGSTPVIIAKNDKGQSLRTEITEDSLGKVDLVRIQSGIPESECDSLNAAINAAFKKNGLEYTRFSKTASIKNQIRRLDLAENNQCNQCQINQINLKQ